MQSQVESGKYSSSEEVILAAIKLLEVRENIWISKLLTLNS
ncbi:type II toxin-antitoxin system ParD family antitoxin [Nostoc sp. CHAB 5824]|nr:type II toxin-antitoxin system ParD family antitoxin [Nostoc sp. CHAB 5824]